MHEGSLAQSALNLALSTARENGASRVKSISLTIGALAQVDPESLKFWLGVLAEDTPAAGAEIRLTETKGLAACPACGNEYEVGPPLWSVICPACGGAGELKSGRELGVTSIEVE
jgi:hydrogenase nickel incorporation protein HypA/HybF